VLFAGATAYLKVGRAADAVQEFRGLLDLKRLAAFQPVLSFAQLGLARSYTLSGDTVKRVPLIRISSPSGKTPIPTSPF
jgi:hypothetical protein